MADEAGSASACPRAGRLAGGRCRAGGALAQAGERLAGAALIGELPW